MTLAVRQSDRSSEVKSGSFAVDCFDNIRTVLTQGGLNVFISHYAQLLHLEQKDATFKAHMFGFVTGLLEFCLWASWALAFWYGGKLVAENRSGFYDMLKAITAVLITSLLNSQLQVRLVVRMVRLEGPGC